MKHSGRLNSPTAESPVPAGEGLALRNRQLGLEPCLDRTSQDDTYYELFAVRTVHRRNCFLTTGRKQLLGRWYAKYKALSLKLMAWLS